MLEAVQGRQITVRDAYLRVLAPALREVGRMWLGDEVSVAEEHFATVVTQNVLARLAPLAPRRPRREHTMVAAAVEGCAHDLATRMIADFFEFDGWRAIPLGADVPAADVTAAVGEIRLMAPYVQASGVIDRQRVADALATLTGAGLVPAGMTPESVVDFGLAPAG